MVEGLHTMNDEYDDWGGHDFCEVCGFCKTCGDCDDFGCHSDPERSPQ